MLAKTKIKRENQDINSILYCKRGNPNTEHNLRVRRFFLAPMSIPARLLSQQITVLQAFRCKDSLPERHHLSSVAAQDNAISYAAQPLPQNSLQCHRHLSAFLLDVLPPLHLQAVHMPAGNRGEVISFSQIMSYEVLQHLKAELKSLHFTAQTGSVWRSCWTEPPSSTSSNRRKRKLFGPEESSNAVWLPTHQPEERFDERQSEFLPSKLKILQSDSRSMD